MKKWLIVSLAILITMSGIMHYNVTSATKLADKKVSLCANKKSCIENLCEYNKYISRIAVYSNDLIWEDTTRTEEFVKQQFGMSIPKCPSGGDYTLKYGRGIFPDIPKLTCSHEDDLDHYETYDY